MGSASCYANKNKITDENAKDFIKHKYHIEAKINGNIIAKFEAG